MNSSHPKASAKPHSMGPSSASSSVSPHLTFNHQTPHPTSKTLKSNPPTPTSTITTHDAPTKQRHHNLSSSSEEEATAQQGTQNDWQQIRRKKNAKGFLDHSPLYRTPKHKSTAAMKFSPKKPPIQTKLKTPTYLRYKNLHRFFYMV